MAKSTTIKKVVSCDTCEEKLEYEADKDNESDALVPERIAFVRDHGAATGHPYYSVHLASE